MSTKAANPVLTRREFSRVFVLGAASLTACAVNIGCGGSGSGSPAPSRSIVNLGNSFIATSINNNGQILGAGNHPNFINVLWQNGAVVNMSSLLPAGSGWQSLSAGGLNDNGDIVGYGTFNGASLHAYLLHRIMGGVYTITDLGNQFIAIGINNKGAIVGGHTGTGAPVLWQDGSITDPNSLLPPGSGWQLEIAAGINNNGDIVGYGTYNGERYHGYWLHQNGGAGYSITDLSNLFIATGINDSGLIVGTLNGSGAGASRQLFWQNGSLTGLNKLLKTGSGWQLQNAASINNSGKIVGYGIYRGADLTAYML